MVFNLTKFIDWPAWKIGDSGAPFFVCFLGSDASTTRIQSLMTGKAVTGRTISVHRLSKNEDGTSCHILYIAHAELKHFDEIAPALLKAAVLTVGDQDSFVAKGGIIGLPVVNDRIQIQINLGSAQKSSLNVSSKLLRIAMVAK